MFMVIQVFSITSLDVINSFDCNYNILSLNGWKQITDVFIIFLRMYLK